MAGQLEGFNLRRRAVRDNSETDSRSADTQLTESYRLALSTKMARGLILLCFLALMIAPFAMGLRGGLWSAGVCRSVDFQARRACHRSFGPGHK